MSSSWLFGFSSSYHFPRNATQPTHLNTECTDNGSSKPMGQRARRESDDALLSFKRKDQQQLRQNEPTHIQHETILRDSFCDGFKAQGCVVVGAHQENRNLFDGLKLLLLVGTYEI